VADTIRDEARKWKGRQLIIGTCGRRGVIRLLPGSDAEAEARAARPLI
jgi:hypothetical protein